MTRTHRRCLKAFVTGWAWAAMVLAALGAGSVQAQNAATDTPYTLRPGDVIVVNVLEDAELDREVLLLPDGRISLPVAGTIKADGRTPQQLASIIRQRLRRNFVEAPNVTVSVSSLAQVRAEEEEDILVEVFVLGEVTRPGRYEYDQESPITVVKALSLAGGLGPFAARSRIQVREVDDDIETLRLFDYEAFEDGQIATTGDLSALSDGAVIVVPERGLFE
ncbi:MAG: polysaccharide biosynthesis/export family protein [Pseudomonadota bacterium]